ncbi:hypothetical protein HYW74_04000 [Candidatus Pacearchaeota archaeon]|nr:hypothetical protein [Candidatus Pacearchaeota archaeon]
MSHIKNKVDWCLKKAEKELNKEGNHRGLIEIQPDLEKAKEHIKKAEHYLKATNYLKKDFSDISASTIFYSMYHCLLAIAVKFGYESRNQECTFALIHSLIEDKKIDLDKEIINKIASLEVKQEERTSIKIREQYQYGTSLSIEDDIYKELFELAKEVISKTKEIILRS